jgi:hypothetical protein
VGDVDAWEGGGAGGTGLGFEGGGVVVGGWRGGARMGSVEGLPRHMGTLVRRMGRSTLLDSDLQQGRALEGLGWADGIRPERGGWRARKRERKRKG